MGLGVGSEHRRKGLELVESFVGDLATQPWPSPRGQPRTPGALERQGLVLLCAQQPDSLGGDGPGEPQTCLGRG